jgi:hypothetical protein
MPIERPKSAPKSTVAKPSRTVELVTDHDPPEPTLKSPPVETPRIVVPMDHHPPEPELSFRARLEPDGNGAEVSARARSRIGVIAVSCVLSSSSSSPASCWSRGAAARSARIPGAWTPAGAPSAPSASSARASATVRDGHRAGARSAAAWIPGMCVGPALLLRRIGSEVGPPPVNSPAVAPGPSTAT